MMRAFLLAAALACVSLACVSPAMAADWVINPAKSSIAFSGTHAGNMFNGVFQKWSGQIRFDPAKLADAKVVILIEMASARTGNKMYDGTLPQDDWFAIKAGRQARFETTSIKATTAGGYVAQGSLNLRGVSVPVTLPFTLVISGKQAVMQGQTSLKRMAFAIGKSSDASGEWVSLDIPLNIKVVAAAK
jgi:polyisoprenoid-binding protein YceI